jgi:Tol biopolymer transport system component
VWSEEVGDVRTASAALVAALALAAIGPAQAEAAGATGTTSLVTVTVDGTPTDDDSCCSAVSDDGRFVAFSSAARNLVADDSTWWLNVYVRDRTAGTTERVSVQPDGRPFEWDADLVTMSGDGRFVYFAVQRHYSDVYRLWVRDRAKATSTLLRKVVAEADVSPNGRWLAYSRQHSAVMTLHLENLVNGTVKLVAQLPDRHGVGPSVADTGDVAFHTVAALDLLDVDGDYDPYLWTRRTGDVRVLPQEAAGGHPLTAGMPAIAAGGGGAVFWADGWILWDRASDTPTFIDEAPYNEFVPLTAVITPDARFVIYTKGEADEHGSTSIHLYDAQTRATERIDVNDYGWATRGDTWTMFPAISPDGRFVAFTSDAPSLVPNLPPYGYLDVFLRDRATSPTPGPLPNLMIRTHDQPFWRGVEEIRTGGDATFVSVSPGTTETVALRVRNASPFPGDVALRGPGSSPRVKLRYFEGDVNVTAAVVAGTYVATLDAREAVTLMLRVHVPRDAARVERATRIRASSVPVPAWRDVMGLRIEVW